MNIRISNLIENEVKKLVASGYLKEGERVKIDKYILEDLLFRKVVRDGKIVKYISTACFDDALKYIDLSEISFDGVDFDCRRAHEEGIISDCVDLSNTNAKIDFSKAASNVLSDVFFRNVDLSNSNIKYIKKIRDVILSNTNIKISDFDGVDADEVFLDGIDLSGRNFSLKSEKGNSYITDGKNKFSRICLNNSNATITVKNEKAIMSALESLTIVEAYQSLDGCLINSMSFTDLEDKIYFEEQAKNKLKK